MAGQHEAIIKVKAQVDDAEKNLKKLESRVKKLADAQGKSETNTRGATEAHVGYIAKLGLAASAVTTVVGKLDEYAQRSVEVNNVTKTLRIEVDKIADAVSHQTDKLTISKEVNRLYAAGLEMSEEKLAEVFGATARLADATGQDLDQALTSTTDAFIKGNLSRLKMIGISEDSAKAERDLAERLGKTVQTLTEEEKRLDAVARFMDQSREASERLGVQTDNLGTRFVALRNQFKDLVDVAVTLDNHVEELAREFDHAFGFEKEQRQKAMNDGFRVMVGILTLGNSEMIRLGMNSGRVMDDIASFAQNARAAQRGLDFMRTDDERAAIAAADERRQAQEAENLRRQNIADREALLARERDTQVIPTHGGGRRGGRRSEPRAIAANQDFDLSVSVSGEAQRLGAAASAEDQARVFEERQVAAQRELEIITQMQGAESQRFEAKLRLLDVEKEAAQWRAENALEGEDRLAAELRMEDIKHEKKIAHMREEQRMIEAAKKAEAERRANIRAMADASVSAYSDMSGAAANAAAATGASAKQQEVITRVTEGGVLLARAISHQVQAGMAFASLNVPMGIAHQAAAAAGFVNAAIFLAGNLPAGRGGAAGGGGGGRGRIAPQGAGGRQQTGPRMADSRTPQSSSTASTDRDRPAVVINMGTSLATKEEVGRAVQEALTAYDRAGGML